VTAALQWIDTHKPPATEMRRITAAQLHDADDQWDGLHHFIAWFLEDGELHAAVVVGIHPNIDPGDYPDILAHALARMVGERMEEAPLEPPIVALSLQIEGYHTKIVQGNPTAEQQQMLDQERDIKSLPDHDEVCLVLSTDVTGQLWWARSFRGRDDVAEGDPDTPPATASHADMMRALGSSLPRIYTTNTEPVVPEALRARRGKR